MSASRIVLLTAAALAVLSWLLLLRAQKKTVDAPLPDIRTSEAPSSTPAVESHRSYTADVLSDVTNIAPGKARTFTYRIRSDREEVLKDFAIAHEKLMHLILVRKDLQHFQHLHPTFDVATGAFTADVTFPTDGPYRLFPDFTPAEGNPQKLPVTVTADVDVGNLQRYAPEAVAADAETGKTVGAYTITMEVPQPPRALSPLTYRLRVEKDGRPVTDFEPYLGAFGHSVILKSDTLDFIHAHAEESEGKRGPEVAFSTTLPTPGLYKIFAQFQHDGRVVTTGYTLAVGPPSGADTGGHVQH